MGFSKSDSTNNNPQISSSNQHRFTNQHRSNNRQQYPHRQNKHNPKHHANQTEIDEHSDEDIYTFQLGKQTSTYPIEINNTTTDVIIESGSTINIIDETAFKNILPKPQVVSTKTRIFPYQSKQPLSIIELFTANITANSITMQDKIYVVSGNCVSLLGKAATEKLDVLHIEPPPQVVRTLKINQQTIPLSTYEIIQQCSDVFQEVSLLKKFQT